MKTNCYTGLKGDNNYTIEAHITFGKSHDITDSASTKRKETILACERINV